MAKEIEGQTLRDYGNRKKRYRRIRRFVIFMLLLAAAAAGLIYWIRLANMRYQNFTVAKQIPNKGGEEAEYIDYGSSVIKYNKDGAEAIDKNGNTVWSGSYEMMDPIADTCGDYAVIADRGNKLLYIYNKKGEVGSIQTLHNIVKAEVAKQGVVAVQMEEGNTGYFKLYYADGSEVTAAEDATLAEMQKDISDNGYPIDFALSEDGKKLVIIFLSFNTGKLVDYIGFFNFGEVGQNWTDRCVGGFKYEGIIVPKVTFLNNDEVCVFKENGVVLYSFPELPDVICEQNYDNIKIKSVLHNEKYAGVVLDNGDDSAGQLILYDLKGKKVLDKKLSFDYDKIYLAGDEIIMYDNLSCVVLKTTGKEKFRYTFTSNIAAFYPSNGLNKYFLINSSDISEITLKE